MTWASCVPHLWRVFGVSLVAMALWACQPHANAPVADKPADAPPVASAEVKSAEVKSAEVPAQPHYSPYTIRLTQGGDFATITFKDVGLSRSAGEGERELLLKTIAHSLAEHIARVEGLHQTPRVAYDHNQLDPNHHLFCEQEHLYVDLWRSEGPPRWGYSLWSGCSEEHNFAWKEVAADSDDMPAIKDVVEPLTSSITDTIARATERRCYLKDCG